MNRQDSENRQIAHHIFAGSTTMIGVCITVIALFRVMKVSMQTYADELLGIDNFISSQPPCFPTVPCGAATTAALSGGPTACFYRHDHHADGRAGHRAFGLLNTHGSWRSF